MASNVDVPIVQHHESDVGHPLQDPDNVVAQMLQDAVSNVAQAVLDNIGDDSNADPSQNQSDEQLSLLRWLRPLLLFLVICFSFGIYMIFSSIFNCHEACQQMMGHFENEPQECMDPSMLTRTFNISSQLHGS